MVTTFNRKDMISFGKYLLSEERRQRFINHPVFGSNNLEERLSDVHHADIENWINSKNKCSIFQKHDIIFHNDNSWKCLIVDYEYAVFGKMSFGDDFNANVSFIDTLIVTNNEDTWDDNFKYEKLKVGSCGGLTEI